MKSLLLLCLAFFVICLGIFAIGVVISFPVRWVFPSVDRGMGILIGVVTAGFSIHYFIRFLVVTNPNRPPLFDDDDDYDEPPRFWTYLPDPPKPKRKRNRKSS